MWKLYICCLVLSFNTLLTKLKSSALEMATGQWDIYIGTTTLTVTSAKSVNTRTRRSTLLTNGFPSILSISFKVGNDDVRLNLRKNFFMDPSPPFYVVRQGKIVREISFNQSNNYAYYQDKDSGAAVMVSVDFIGGDYLLTGNYFHGGEEYSIQPINGNRSQGADHVIYKLHQGPTPADRLHQGPTPAVIAVTDKHLREDKVNISQGNKTNDINVYAGIHQTHFFDSDEKRNISSPINNESTFEISRDYIYISDDSEIMNLAIKDENHKFNEMVGAGQARKKRQTKNYVVELLVVIDYGVYEKWLDGVKDSNEERKRSQTLLRIKQFYSFVLNGIDLRYNSVQRNADFTIDVTWAGIVVFDKPDPGFWKNSSNPPLASRDLVESSAALEAFREWGESQGQDLPASDHVMLFTGHNLTYGGSVSNAGLAYLGSACNSDYFYSIVEEYFEFRDVAIAAHELGHSLGARHDMDGNTCLSFDRYIMTSRFQFPTFRKAQNPWLFSPCSIDYFKSFIETLNKNETNCLVTKQSTTDNKEIQPFLNSLPGEVYAGDDFCRIGDGHESYICRDHHMLDYTSICFAGIYCYSPTFKQCIPKLPPDGFSCGNKKWCLNGTCQFSELAPVTQGDDCPFGDDPGLIEGKTCPELMMTLRSNCYRDIFRARCCLSCSNHRLHLLGCEYGDMFDLCDKVQCTAYDVDYARENCCETCSELFYTMGSRTREVTPTGSQRETINTNLVHGKVETTTSSRAEETAEQTNTNKIKQVSHHKPELGSEEQETSSDKSKKYLHRNRFFQLLRPRWLKQQEKRNGRMSQIYSFLRNQPDYTPLNKLRLLVFLLYKTRQKEISDNDKRNDYVAHYKTGVNNESASIRPISARGEALSQYRNISLVTNGQTKGNNNDNKQYDETDDESGKEDSEESK